MAQFIIRRLLLVIPVLIGILLVTFTITAWCRETLAM